MAQIVQDVEGPIALRSVNIIHGLSGRPAQPKEGIIPALRSPWSVEIRGAIHNLRLHEPANCTLRDKAGYGPVARAGPADEGGHLSDSRPHE